MVVVIDERPLRSTTDPATFTTITTTLRLAKAKTTPAPQKSANSASILLVDSGTGWVACCCYVVGQVGVSVG